MKILVLVEAYPTLQGDANLYYVHTRNLCYKENGIAVTVLNFTAKEDYTIDGISVISLSTYMAGDLKRFGDILVLHAANIKHHFVFIEKYGSNFKEYVFFFHGHEVLRELRVYPSPYNYVKRTIFKEYGKDIYDVIKLWIWRKKFEKIYTNTQFVFVSQWMLDEFLKWVKLDKKYLSNRCHIIYNCIGKEFEKVSYDRECDKQYDFVSIRSNFDGSKYCVDVICRIAKENPQCKFCLIGKGNYFKYRKKPDNITVVSKYLKHDEMLNYLNVSKCALMPTRTDAQGVMACEMATYGIPLITSDISVCKEVFDGFDNVEFISNNANNQDILKIYQRICKKMTGMKNQKYFGINTNIKEVDLLTSRHK